MSRPPAFIQEEGEDGEDEDYGNRPKIATRKGGTDVDGLKDDSSFSNCDPCYWTHGQVMEWLATTPWKNYGPVFHEHGITGHHLALLDRPELASMGMRRVADQMDFLEAIPVERSVYGSRPTDVPNKFMALFEAMISTKYARTSKGKTPAQIKEEFMSINNCVALLSALLMTVSFDFLTWGYGEMEEMMDKPSAILFIACAFISGLFFAMSLMMAIFQMIMCTQVGTLDLLFLICKSTCAQLRSDKCSCFHPLFSLSSSSFPTLAPFPSLLPLLSKSTSADDVQHQHIPIC